MALDLTVTYAGKVDATDGTNYPYGKAREVTTSGDGTGTPWAPDLVNDWLGFFQRLLTEASITPSGTADTIVASDYFDALDSLIGSVSVPAATTSTAGISRYATGAETITGTETAAAVTPDGLQDKAASDAQTIAGTATNLFTTPASVQAKAASDAETITGTSTTKFTTPANIDAVFDSRIPLEFVYTSDELSAGISALGAVTSGTGNVAFGYQCADNSTYSYYSTFFGYNIARNHAGTGNTAMGYQAGRDLGGGDYNTFMGMNANDGESVSDYCTAIGYNTSTGNNQNCTALGNGAFCTGSNQVQLGNSSTTTYVYGTVQDRSDERDKTDIEDSALGLDFVNMLRPVSFKWDYREDYKTEKYQDLGTVEKDGTKKRTRPHYGLIAQEVKTVLDLLGVDWGGYQDHSINGGQDVKSIGYAELIAPMIKAIQELSAKVKELETKLEA